MVAANFRWTHSPSRLASSGVGGHPALSLHSSNEPGKIFGHDDRTMNTVVVIIIIIIITIIIIIITDVDVDVDLDPDPDLDSGVSTVDAVIACVVFDRPIMPNTT